MSWLRTIGLAVLLVFAGIGGASILGYDVSLEADEPTTAGPVGTATDSAQPATETSAGPTSTPVGQTAGYDQNAVRERFYTLLNEFRAENGRTELSEASTVVRAAEAHSEDMADRGYFSHDNPEGEGPSDRLRQTGARCSRSGENIAQTWWEESLTSGPGPAYIDSADDLARALFIQWRESPGHREVMLIRGLNDAGLGLAQTPEGKIYATLDVC